MPNYVYSSFHVKGDRNEIERFKQTMFKTTTSDGSNYIDGIDRQEIILDFGAVLPIPSGEGQDWCVENWGTKWPGFDVEFGECPDGTLHFQFTTAWDFPTPAFDAIAAEFPSLVFDGSAYEEDHAFELTGQFNGDNSWGPGELDFIII